MKRKEKLDIVTQLIEKGNGRFTVKDLKDAAGSDRVARSAIFLSRKSGMKLEAVRSAGRKIDAYILLKQNQEVKSAQVEVVTSAAAAAV